MHSVYSTEELFEKGGRPCYPDTATEAAFCLGGIGTGTISVNSRGELIDWEIQNHPDTGNKAYYSFFSIWTCDGEGKKEVKVLEARRRPPYTQARGYHSGTTAGLPRMRSSVMKAEYPFVTVAFEDDSLPVEVRMEAFTPFIPLDADNSGIPGAVLRYYVKNRSGSPVSAAVAGSLLNQVGFHGYDCFDNLLGYSGGKNQWQKEEGLNGLFLTNTEIPREDLRWGTMALATREASVTAKPEWLKGYWWDHVQDFWDDFADDGRLEEFSKGARPVESVTDDPKVGSLAVSKEILPGEEECFEFFLTWCFPNRPAGWEPRADGKTTRNYYSVRFPEAWSAARYLAQNLEELEGKSRLFTRAFFSSTLPDYVLDAVAANITTIRSNTCFRIEDGTFLAWEGCHEKEGSCEGTCTHVWNYAQTLAYLFPQLERSARKVEFGLETDETGKMAFRTQRVFGLEPKRVIPAGDGQMGTILRLYREWRLSGDDAFLRGLWDKAKKAMEFALENWDADHDYVLDGTQHNTYDIAFEGIDPLANVLYLGALKAMANMAEYFGEEKTAQRYRDIWGAGSAAMDRLLWNGEYYQQNVENVNEFRYQLGSGCLSDQLFGQTLAHLSGLGYLLPPEHVKKAIASVYRYNFRTSFAGLSNVQRTFALEDDKGLTLCSWPRGGRPFLPFVYSDEVWAGVEYQVATLLIYEGFLEEGLTVVKALRERYDGYRRNPFNEVECGNHYARSLASYGLLVALSGMEWDGTKRELSFHPAVGEEDFSTFFCVEGAWGIYRQRKTESGEWEKEVKVLYP